MDNAMGLNLAQYLRLREGLTITELHKATGIASEALRAIEQNQFGAEAITLAAFYGLTAEALLTNNFEAAFTTFFLPPVPSHRLYINQKKPVGYQNPSGVMGEEWVYLQEIIRLRHTVYRNAVNPNYSSEENTHFDILSFTEEGEPIAIEVKSTVKSREKSFQMTSAEIELARRCYENGWRYELHCVYHATKPQKRSRHIITVQELFEQYAIEPKQFSVRKNTA